MIWDLSDLTAPDVPANLRTQFYFNADQWDGFPNKRKELLKYLGDNKVNALFISGDIHASFASVEKADPRLPTGIPTLTTPAISSSSIRDLAGGAVISAGYPATSTIYRRVITEMEDTLRKSNPGLAFTNTDAHGLVVLEVGATDALATFHLIPSTEVKTDYTGNPDALAAKFTSKALRVSGGTIKDA
jgi:alkaline phosphatase D